LIILGGHVPDYRITVRRRTWWIGILIVILLLLIFVVVNKPTPAASNGDSVAISLKAVPTIRSVTVSPGKASFGNCSGGNAAAQTASTSQELGYPNGRCWLGAPGSNGDFPVKITYQGPPGKVFVNGSGAVPSDGGSGWSLCNKSTACTGPGGLPGANQYMAKTFSLDRNDSTGLTGTLSCDQEFSTQGCPATAGETQREGVELIGPASSGDTSTSWTITITWAAAPPG
jgi:hypothetical protein